MGLNIDSSVKTNKPIIINKKKGLERQTEKALNDYKDFIMNNRMNLISRL